MTPSSMVDQELGVERASAGEFKIDRKPQRRRDNERIIGLLFGSFLEKCHYCYLPAAEPDWVTPAQVVVDIDASGSVTVWMSLGLLDGEAALES